MLNLENMSRVIEVSFTGSAGEVVGSQGQGWYLKHGEFERRFGPCISYLIFVGEHDTSIATDEAQMS
jgi:hypothetical protein